MKVAIVGGGGFRTPLLVGALARLSDVTEVVLFDVSGDRLARIAAVLRASPRTPFRVETSTDRDRALEGADAVLVAIRPGGMGSRIVDESVPIALGVLGQETVGPGGVAFALRTIPAVRDLAATIERRAPTAWVVNFTNPVGIVTESVRDVLGDRVVGVCDSPTALCARVAAALEPSTDPVFDYAGLNHLGWIVGIRDDRGRDLLRPLLADDERLGRVEEAVAFGPERVRALGALPNEYLLYFERSESILDELRARGVGRAEEVSEQQRGFLAMPLGVDGALRDAWRAALDRRNATYLSEARPNEPAPPAPDGPGEEGYAAVAVDFLAALRSGSPARMVLDTANRGRLHGIDEGEVVEVSCDVDREGVRPVPGAPLPQEAADLVARIKEVERLTIRSATTGSAALALEAIATHPLVPSREVASRILDGYLDRLPEIREAIA